ncbi:uncharacterized protein BYT42DRAFT_545659 [Radiomyces spectabilis]|uniref:uncharacterized protein n=1 Tax=Radiomyces spectabilis TaxID=64574 RepID=UPI00221EF151|nr:uncharacterized protein BYT42DRAFT_545659 [Radiomyces spectabilis]KAI8379276.1 hypothetical protein BYT42DRAFT_545659 [Radiomyces spectabilis]
MTIQLNSVMTYINAAVKAFNNLVQVWPTANINSTAAVPDAVAEYKRKFNIVLNVKRFSDCVTWFTCKHYGECRIRKSVADNGPIKNKESSGQLFYQAQIKSEDWLQMASD